MLATDIDSATASAAAAGGAEKRAYVKRIFSEIAPRYDLLNHVLSLNIDRRWRRKAIASLGVERDQAGRYLDLCGLLGLLGRLLHRFLAPLGLQLVAEAFERDQAGRYLDLCAGTMDVAAEISRLPGFRGMVIGADFAEPMLRAGAEKIRGTRIAPVTADAVQLPLASGQLAGAIVAFGIRNVAALDDSLNEAFRVLVRGGRFVILEFSTPRIRMLRVLYQLYFHHVLPLIGRLISGHRTAYQYLPRSVANFPVEEELARRMEAAGFAKVSWSSLSLGVAAIHVGERPTSGRK